jgi:hypothetical protein
VRRCNRSHDSSNQLLVCALSIIHLATVSSLWDENLFAAPKHFTLIHVAASLFTECSATRMGLMNRKRTTRCFFGQRSSINATE